MMLLMLVFPDPDLPISKTCWRNRIVRMNMEKQKAKNHVLWKKDEDAIQNEKITENRQKFSYVLAMSLGKKNTCNVLKNE